ncbi:MAG TPA: HAD family hydrolase [Dyella sp.]|uniref:HAD family hydrolase n=1 Tax=Dyella sp. TaxID=1869338 RepID=UPI002C0547D1|nr:HAD family hydrolase [Dyella sp.]HTV86208.1 HAD family hydrolase [Dyella sp.]
MNLALFDFDGTITQREMFADFVRAAVSTRRRLAGALLFGPMLAGYKLGLVSANAIRASVVHFGFRGVPADVVDEAGRRFALDVLPAALRPDALARIRWHRQQGDRVMVVSGALDVYLAHWCRHHELDLLCSRLETRGGVLTGRYRGAQCVGAEKSRRIREVLDLDEFPVIYAYGDTHEDLDMLRLAHRRYYRGQELA